MLHFSRCASNLNDFGGECPFDGPGIYPNCNCGAGKSFDKLQKTCVGQNRNTCPSKSTGL